ncbi:hypothetical protein HKX48_002853, partial [Thoreauomyces humboldtii]
MPGTNGPAQSRTLPGRAANPRSAGKDIWCANPYLSANPKTKSRSGISTSDSAPGYALSSWIYSKSTIYAMGHKCPGYASHDSSTSDNYLPSNVLGTSSWGTAATWPRKPEGGGGGGGGPPFGGNNPSWMPPFGTGPPPGEPGNGGGGGGPPPTGGGPGPASAPVPLFPSGNDDVDCKEIKDALRNIPHFDGEKGGLVKWREFMNGLEQWGKLKRATEAKVIRIAQSRLRGSALTWWKQVETRCGSQNREPNFLYYKFMDMLYKAYFATDNGASVRRKIGELQEKGTVEHHNSDFGRLTSQIDTPLDFYTEMFEYRRSLNSNLCVALEQREGLQRFQSIEEAMQHAIQMD